MPDITITPVLMDTLHNGLHCIYLIGAHHHEFLFADNLHHVTADHFAQGAFGEKLFGEVVQMDDFLIIFSRKLINRQEAFISIKAEGTAVIIGKIPGGDLSAIDFQIINFTRPEGGDNTSSISPTDNAVKLFMWKSITTKS